MPISEVFNIDCMEYMRKIPDDFFDLAVVDPPYGIGITGAPGGATRGQSRSGGGAAIGGAKPFGNRGGGLIVPPKSYHAFDDQEPPRSEYFSELKRVAKNQIIWGGNYFLDHLGATPCMICWDKRRVDLNFADGEFAWTSFKTPARIFRFKWNGLLQENMREKEFRIHPTQKPVALYAWIFDRFAKPGDKILDTHLGSGSSRIAAWDAGLDFYGCEIDKVYFDQAAERFEAHAAQISLFNMAADQQKIGE